MIQLNLTNEQNKPLSLLLLGAHCDDIEIGCGGTILSLLADNCDVFVKWVVFSSNSIRHAEANKCANMFISNAPKKEVIIKDFRNGYFPYIGGEIKDYFENLKQQIPQPDIIFTHYRKDLHQDHRIISELTWNTYRNHFILEYEIPKYDGDLKHPNFFCPISDTILNNKFKLINDCYISQRNKQWFTNETFRAISRIRGVESNSPTGLAEAFYCRKLTLSI